MTSKSYTLNVLATSGLGLAAHVATAAQSARLTLTTHVGGPILFSQGTISGVVVNAPQ
jgi:hypothetical protein